MSAPQAGLGGEPSDFERAAFLRNQPVWFAVHSWLKWATFDEVVNLWWLAQNEKADEEDKRQARRDNPDDMYAKSPQYVADWYAKRRADGRCED